MEGVKLSEVELRLFGELFGLCDMDSSGAVSPSKATELFLSSGLPQETLQKVFELCGATRIHQFGRSQFYIALKLIAVAQCGLPVQVESLAAQNIPLPRFNIQRSDMGAPPLANRQNSNPQHINSDPEYTMRASLQHQRSLQQQQQMVQQQQIQQHQQLQQQQLYQQQFQQQQNQQEYYQQQQAPFPQPQQFRSPTQPPAPPPHHQHPPPQRFMAQGPGDAFVEGQLHQMEKPLQKSEHPEVKPAFSPQENSPPNSPLEKVNGVANAAIGYVQYEGATPQQQAAPNNSANRIEKGWASFEDDSQGLLSGSTANVNQENEVKDWAHFTDSAGSKADTSSISSEAESTDDVWTITDEQREYYVNQFRTMQTDVRGVISGGIAKEFFEKSRLPVQELSRIWQLSDVNRDGALSLEEFCTAMHLVVLRRNDIDLPDTLPPSLMPYLPLTNPDEPFAADLPPGGTMKKLSTASETSQQWGQASPTSSSVSSPGSKPTPVNFEFKPITADSDSQIVHPVALRMSPDGQVTAVDGKGQPEEEAMNASSTAFTNDLVDLGPSDQPSIQSRPRPKKQHSVPATLPDQSQPFIRPPPSDFASERPSVLEMGSSDKPVPPPRKGHSRHASLDNQLLDFLDGEKHAVTPPSADADLIDLPDNESLHGKASRSQSYLGSDDGLDLLPRSNQALPRHGSLDRKDIQALVRKHRDKNIILTRLNSELNQELQEVMEQRIALEIQLEHLKP